MVRIITLIGLLHTISHLLISQNSTYAFLAGIGNYPTESGWNKLASSNDLDLLQKSLIDFGIPKNNISVKKDEKLSKIEFLGYFETELIQKVKAGDMAFFHFSGHGQQIPDKNNDEIDQLDEALVAYDSPKFFQKNKYEGQNLITDDELNKIFDRLRKKLGPSGRLIISIDACHSGSATRGIVNARGTDIIMAENQEDFYNLGNSDERANFDNINSDANLASQINLFSSGSHQLSYEFTGKKSKLYGLYTYALCTSLYELYENDSYRDLWNKLFLFISSQTSMQTPYAEGRINEKVFGKQLQAPSQTYSIKKILASELLVMGAGAIQGITEGSTIAIYKRDDSLFRKPQITGYVDGVDAFTSDIILDKKWKEKNPGNYKIKITQVQLEELRVKVKINAPAKFDKDLTKALTKSDIISFNDRIYELLIHIKNLKNDSFAYILTTKDGQLLSKSHFINNILAQDISDDIIYDIMKYTRAKNFRALESKDNFFQASIDILQQDSLGNFIPTNKSIFKEKDSINIRINNYGKEPFYFALFDILPNSEIKRILPDEGRKAIDYLLQPGKSFLYPNGFEIEKPFGIEVLKLICSKEPIDFGQFRGGNTKVSKNPIQQLINNLTSPGMETRGLKPTLSSDQGYIGSKIFIIEQNLKNLYIN